MIQNAQENNKLDKQDVAFHDWYRFVLAYPAHLVRAYLADFAIKPGQLVLDPFSGTGTTLIEAKLAGIASVGTEANPFAHFASTVKVDWAVDATRLRTAALEIAATTLAQLQAQGIDDNKPFAGTPEDAPLRTLDAASAKLLISGSVSPIPLHKTLVLIDSLRAHRRERYYNHALLALANALVCTISNSRFGPEVGVGKVKSDVPVVAAWLSEVERIALDLLMVSGQSYPEAKVYLADARQLSTVLTPNSVDAIITSPPYPNEKDYTRTTRLESVILGLITSKTELRAFKKRLIRSNTRVVYKDDDDDQWIAGNSEVARIAEEIEKKRIEQGKTSGFERLYGRVTKLYFGGMARHLADLREVLKPGAMLAYVVGDQASYLRVMIRTGQLLSEIAEALGYEPVRIDQFRTRFSTVTREQLHEDVVVLKWPGAHQKEKPKMITERVIPPGEVAGLREDGAFSERASFRPNRYVHLILEIWREHYEEGISGFEFNPQELAAAASKLGIALPKNLHDVLCTIRYRGDLPPEISSKAPEGYQWSIISSDSGRYRFQLVKLVNLTPNQLLGETKVTDRTPGGVVMYAQSDKQALLAKLRYNRLIDAFTGLECYSLQTHLRTQIGGMGQAETDEVYIGMDKLGVHYVLPLQAKGSRDRLRISQIAQDLVVCQMRWPNLVCRPVAVQSTEDAIVLFELARDDKEGFRIVAEKRYRLLPPEQSRTMELREYPIRPE